MTWFMWVMLVAFCVVGSAGVTWRCGWTLREWVQIFALCMVASIVQVVVTT